MNRVRTLMAGVALCFMTLTATTAYGQTWERSLRLVPEKPVAGTAFTVVVEVPGEQAEDLEAREPLVTGPARYVGADVHPGATSRGGSSSVVEYRFFAEGPGRADIIDIALLVRGRVVHLGTWAVDIAAGNAAPAARYGSWRAPDRVIPGMLFEISALDPDGVPVWVLGLMVRGAIVEALAGTGGVFLAVALEPGILLLPALELKDKNGDFGVEQRRVIVEQAPPAAAGTAAIGGPWTLRLVSPREPLYAKPGDAIAWELLALGPGWPGFAAPPTLTIRTPGGQSYTAVPGDTYGDAAGDGLVCRSGVSGVFVVVEEGVYEFMPEPFTWYEPGSGLVMKALAPPVKLAVTAAPAPEAWVASGSLVAWAVRSLDALAGDSPSWRPAAAAAASGDWESAARYAREAFGSASASTADTIALASTLALVGSPESRAEAYGLFLDLERAAFADSRIALIADELALSFGNHSRDSYVLPAFGPLLGAGVPGLLVALAMMVVSVARSRAGAKPRRAFRAAQAIVSGLALLMLALALASAYERSIPRFVSLGGVARAVPSEEATKGSRIEPGVTGRVLETADGWVFVELDDGDSAWLARREVVCY